MSCTIFYKGTLKDSATPEPVFACVADLTEQVDCHLQREGMTMTVFFNTGTSEPLVLAFENNKIDGFCKWNGEAAEEFYRILDLFIRIKPWFKLLKIEDDDGLWHSYVARNKASKITLHALEADNEQQLLRRMLENQALPLDELEALLIGRVVTFPQSLPLLRIIISDFIQIMNWRAASDVDPKDVIERAHTVGFGEGYPVDEEVRNFSYTLPYLLLRIWFGYAFTYKTHGLVYQIPDETRGLATSKIAALFGTVSLFLGHHSGGATNAKEAEMIKLAAQHYPAASFGVVQDVDEPQKQLAFFVSMMDYLGFHYIGT